VTCSTRFLSEHLDFLRDRLRGIWFGGLLVRTRLRCGAVGSVARAQVMVVRLRQRVGATVLAVLAPVLAGVWAVPARVAVPGSRPCGRPELQRASCCMRGRGVVLPMR